MDYIIYLLIAVFVVIVLVAIIRSLNKRGTKTTDELLSELSDDQIKDLKENQVKDFNEEKVTWNQKALIIQVAEKGNGYSTKVVWYNTILPNAMLNTFQYSVIKIKKEQFHSKRLKTGSIVTVFIDAKNIKFSIL